jgi:hypothetical protein
MKVLKTVANFITGFLTVLHESKKAKATFVSLVVLLAGKVGFNLDDTVIYSTLAIITAYVLSQGLADVGKEAAKVELKVAESNVKVLERLADYDEDAN